MHARPVLSAALVAFVALAAPVAVHASPGTLSLTVRGDVDADLVRGRVERELSRPVALTGDRCATPCLVVTVGRDSATIVFTPAAGAPRVRTVDLGDDTEQWPTMITLLAGNLVRDEASDVLALLPEPAAASSSVAPVPQTATLMLAPLAPSAAPALALRVPAAPAPASFTITDRVVRITVPAPDPSRPSRMLGVGFIPFLSTDLAAVGQVHHQLSLDLVAGVSGGSTGLTLSGVADIERGPVWGVQLAGVASVAHQVHGVQVGGVAAVAGDFIGVQLAGAAAFADRVNGFQVAGVAAVAGAQADLQVAGVATVARGRASTQAAGVLALADGASDVQFAGAIAAARGATNIQAAGALALAHRANVQAAGAVTIAGDANVQAAGAVAIARDANLQIAGALNVARDVDIQLAGALNVARRVDGVQVAPFNVARRGAGAQVGVVNIGSADGVSIGLINIVPGGRTDLEASVDSSGLGQVLLRHGGRRWHNVYGVGGAFVEDKRRTVGSSEDLWMYGLGFGPTFYPGSTVLDIEAIGWQVNQGPNHYDGVSVLGQLRATLAFSVGPLSLVAGGSVNTYISSDQDSPLFLERRSAPPKTSRDVTVELWPSAFVGLRI